MERGQEFGRKQKSRFNIFVSIGLLTLNLFGFLVESFDGGLAVVNSFIYGRALLHVGGGYFGDSEKNLYKKAGRERISMRTIDPTKTPNNYQKKILKNWYPFIFDYFY